MIRFILLLLLLSCSSAPKIMVFDSKAEMEAWKKAHPDIKIITERGSVIEYK